VSEHLDAIGIGREFEKYMKNCEVCDHDEFDLLQERGRIAQAGVYGPNPIYCCKRCGYKMQNPRYEDGFYESYYEKLYREVAFGQTAPDQADIDEQIERATGVMEYVHRFVSPPGAMLDHGCAAGGTMLPFKDAGWDVFGVDPHRPSVETGKEHLKLDIRVGAGEDLPFDSDSIDLIFSLGSTEHAYDFDRMMREAHRVLKPGGWFLIRWRSEVLWGSPLEYYNHNHYRFFTPKTWEIALLRYGFTMVDSTDVEYEKKPGEVYIMAQADREPSLDTALDAIASGRADDWRTVRDELQAYRVAYAERCQAYMDFHAEHGGDAKAIAQAVRSGQAEFRILLGEEEWAVERARMESERYLNEYNAGGVI